MEHKTICTPFNKTGYCKFGDACKYSHIRINTSKVTLLCGICKKEIVDPVTTNCNHEYCRECVMTSDMEKCNNCGEALHGIFYNKE